MLSIFHISYLLPCSHTRISSKFVYAVVSVNATIEAGVCPSPSTYEDLSS
jgi:hypothetical protein